MSKTFTSFEEWDAYIEDSLTDQDCDIRFTVQHINTRSVKKHWDLLRTYLCGQTVTPDALALCETNLEESECGQYTMNGYIQYNFCRKERKGGGILVFNKCNHICEPLSYAFSSAES